MVLILCGNHRVVSISWWYPIKKPSAIGTVSKKYEGDWRTLEASTSLSMFKVLCTQTFYSCPSLILSFSLSCTTIPIICLRLKIYLSQTTILWYLSSREIRELYQLAGGILSRNLLHQLEMVDFVNSYDSLNLDFFWSSMKREVSPWNGSNG